MQLRNQIWFGAIGMLTLFCCCKVYAAEEIRLPGGVLEASIRETEALRGCEVRRACPVYFVMALGGYFPIPVRYHLLNGSGSTGKQLSFGSPVSTSLRRFIYTDSNLGSLGDKGLIGMISIGKTKDIIEAQKANTITLSSIKRVGAITVAQMSSPDYPALTAGPFGGGITVLYNSDDYVQIGDANRELVDALLRIYLYVNSPPE